MSINASTPLTDLSASQSKKEVTINENFDAVSPAGCYGMKHWPVGLTVELYGGTVYVSGTPTKIYDPDGYSDDVDDDSTIYIRVNTSGVISWVNAGETPAPHPGWPSVYSVYQALYELTTAGGVVTGIIDWRTAGGPVGPSGATGATGPAGPSTLPQNSKSAAYTTVIGDAGGHIFHPSSDASARTWTIDSNANVAYPIGTTITFVNQNGAGIITIAITSDTMRLAGTGTTGSRTLAANGLATALKIASTEWIINGTGLS